MLHESTITAFIPTVDPAQSKQFYNYTLGLKLVHEDNYAMEFEGKGAALRITTVQELNPHPFTVLGFKISGITSLVSSLIKRGVSFERYDSLDQDELGIWTSPSNARIAWFKDPDGNLLSLTEYTV